MTGRSALILAGGKARRFQPTGGGKWEDKALALLAGKPLLVHAVESVREVVDEVLLCVSDEQRGLNYLQILKDYGLGSVDFVVDAKSGIGGPTLAIMTGLKSAQSDFCLTLPCDVPFLKPQVADYMFRQATGFDVTVPMWPNGRVETLITVLERHSGLEITETLCKLTRPRSDDIQRGAAKILFVSPLAEIKGLDPELKSFVNINSKEELKNPQTRPTQGEVKENLPLTLRPRLTAELQSLIQGADLDKEGKFSEAEKVYAACAGDFEEAGSFFWAATSWENQGLTLHKQSEAIKKSALGVREAFLKAASNYGTEAEMYEKNRCMLLAQRACADEEWCESTAAGKDAKTHRTHRKLT